VVLDTQPTADVTIGLSSSDLTEGTVAPASLTFTSGNWSSPRPVTVTGVDDLVQDGNIAYTILTAAASSGDGYYNGLDAADVSVTNLDNDTAGITVNPTSGLVTSEGGGTAQFHRGARHPAHGRCDHRPEQLGPERGHRRPGQRDLQQRQLEHAAAGHGDGVERPGPGRGCRLLDRHGRGQQRRHLLQRPKYRRRVGHHLDDDPADDSVVDNDDDPTGSAMTPTR